MTRSVITLALGGALLAVPLDAQEFDRTRPPVLGPAPTLALPPIVERTLPNGLRLILVRQAELPVVDMTLVVRAGSETDPADQSGLASLMASLMTDGAADRSADDIAEQQAFLGISVGSGATFDRTTISLHAPTAVLDSAIALFADVALRPTFPMAEFERAKQQRLTGLMQTADRAPAIADRAFNAIVYGDAHPYGRPTAGIERSVEAITRNAVVAFHRAHFAPSEAFLLVVGDIDIEAITQRLATRFGAWAATPPLRRSSSTSGSPVASPRRIYLVDKPGAAQSSFRIGTVGVARATEDYYPLQVLNTVLGGAFTSRLNLNLRETNGYTYGAGSAFAMRREPGPFVARAEIVAAKSDSALLEFLKELAAIRERIPASELDKAKQYLQLGLPSEFETTQDISAALAALALYDIPLTQPAEAIARIGAVTAEDVQRVARRYLDPARMAIVIVGDAAAIEGSLRATGVAPLERRDSYGRPIIVP
jgi:zinc protease